MASTALDSTKAEIAAHALVRGFSLGGAGRDNTLEAFLRGESICGEDGSRHYGA